MHAADIASRVPDTLAAFVGIAGHVFGFFFVIFELIFLTLFLLCDLPQFSDSIEGMLYPESAERYHRLREQITTTISRYAVGAVAIANHRRHGHGSHGLGGGSAVSARTRPHRRTCST